MPEPVNSEFRDDRFTAAFDRKQDDSPVFTVAYVVRAVSPAVTFYRRPSSRICTGPTVSAAPAPHQSRSRRQNETLAHHRCERSHRDSACLRRLGLFAGPAPLGKNLDTSHVVLDRDGKLLRAYATADGRWRLAATIEDVDPRSSRCCSATRISASTSITALILLPWAARRFSCCRNDI